MFDEIEYESVVFGILESRAFLEFIDENIQQRYVDIVNYVHAVCAAVVLSK